MPVELSVAFTCAFGTEAPEGSVTVPLIAPRNVCAFTPTASDKTTRIAKTRRFIFSTPPHRDRTATNSTRALLYGRALEKRLHPDRFQFPDRDLFSKSPFAKSPFAKPSTSSPAPLALLWFKKPINQYDQYGCGV